MRRIPRGALLLSVFSAVPLVAYSQTTATVNGVVTDSSGAIIQGAAVVLSNPSTGVRYEVKTDSAGSYRVANVPPGPGYGIEFNAEGFVPFKVNDIYVNVANSRTQNAKLQAGGSTVEVQVSDSAGVTLNTTDATIGNNFQVSKLQDLPVQDRTSPSVLFTLQPGITSSGATMGAYGPDEHHDRRVGCKRLCDRQFRVDYRKCSYRFHSGVPWHDGRLYGG